MIIRNSSREIQKTGVYSSMEGLLLTILIVFLVLVFLFWVGFACCYCFFNLYYQIEKALTPMISFPILPESQGKVRQREKKI